MSDLTRDQIAHLRYLYGARAVELEILRDDRALTRDERLDLVACRGACRMMDGEWPDDGEDHDLAIRIDQTPGVVGDEPCALDDYHGWIPADLPGEEDR